MKKTYKPTKDEIQQMIQSMIESEISEYTDMIVENLEEGSPYPIDPKDYDRIKDDAEKLLLHIINDPHRWSKHPGFVY
jgi:hypothetical protein